RRSDRLPLAAPPDWELLAEALGAAARQGPVQVHVVAEGIRDPLAEASHLAEAVRLLDAAYHNEMTWWTADFSTGEGIPRSALVSA
ncbi:NAD(P)H nitroreductase, partial [Mycobacterium sp. ITM-2017-0098]